MRAKDCQQSLDSRPLRRSKQAYCSHSLSQKLISIFLCFLQHSRSCSLSLSLSLSLNNFTSSVTPSSQPSSFYCSIKYSSSNRITCPGHRRVPILMYSDIHQYWLSKKGWTYSTPGGTEPSKSSCSYSGKKFTWDRPRLRWEDELLND